MRLRFSLLLLISLFLGACGTEATEGDGARSPLAAPVAPVTPEPEPPASVSGASIRFESDTIDFGEVWDFETLESRFEFENVGTEPLLITDVKPSCGCTPVELERNRFEPGEKDAIEVIWNLKGFGHQAKSIAVTTNSVGAPMTMLTVRAQIRPFASFQPTSLRLGELEIGEAHTATATLTCVDPDFELISVASGTPKMTARDAGRTAEGGVIVEVTLEDTINWGSYIGQTNARIRGRMEGMTEPIEHTVHLSVSASLLGDLRITPQLLTVGRVAPGGKIFYEAQLRSDSGRDFEVTELRVENSKPPGMEARVEPVPGGGMRLLVEGESGDYLGLIRGFVVVGTDIPDEGLRRLPVMGIVRE